MKVCKVFRLLRDSKDSFELEVRSRSEDVNQILTFIDSSQDNDGRYTNYTNSDQDHTSLQTRQNALPSSTFYEGGGGGAPEPSFIGGGGAPPGPPPPLPYPP